VLAQLLAQSRYLLVLIFMLNTFLNVLLQNVASDMFGEATHAWAVKVVVPLALILIFGEFLPKYLGMMSSESFALRVAPFYLTLERFLAPVQRLVTTAAEMLSRIFFFFLKPEPPMEPHELEGVIDTCETNGVLSAEDASLIRHALEFEEKEARALMTPRSEIVAIKQSSLSRESLGTDMRGAPTQPFLVVEETMDQPIGVITGHEALLLQSGEIPRALEAAAKLLFFVPETMSARRLLQEFAERRAVMACVTDEHGMITGCIEIEALAKTLLGFASKKTPAMTLSGRTKQRSIVVPGTTPLSVINDMFHTSFSSEHHCSTIGGWLVEAFDGIPPPGTTHATASCIFRILSTDEKRIKQLFIQSTPARTEPSNSHSQGQL
jgi:CBS domain containing-hemolysin-like protein